VHTLLVVDEAPTAAGGAPEGAQVVVDHARRAQARLDARPGTAYLLRPDQHVAARWRALHLSGVQAALSRATGQA
jgi:3-(3-hydroxy-phenyl)propionate hydroxylase